MHKGVRGGVQGYNAAIIAYGQTGTGKTHTMEGALEGEGRGIIPRAIQDIFHAIQTDTAPSAKYLVRASYLQIYNEVRAPPDARQHSAPHWPCGASSCSVTSALINARMHVE